MGKERNSEFRLDFYFFSLFLVYFFSGFESANCAETSRAGFFFIYVIFLVLLPENL